MSCVAARRLGADDIVALRSANALFAETFEDFVSYAASPPPDAYLGGLLAREQFVALIAEAQGAVVGALVAYELDTRKNWVV